MNFYVQSSSMRLNFAVTLISVLQALNIFAASPYNAVVDARGGGDFVSISEAVAAVPDSLDSPWLILVKAGDYEEHLVIPENKPYIHLIGEGSDRTVVHYMVNIGKSPQLLPRYNKTAYWDYSTKNPESENYGKKAAVVNVDAPHFLAYGMAFVNDWGARSASGPQALALYSNADCATFGDCLFKSYQDTWRTADADSCRAYARKCRIEGAVDYLYGGGELFADSCEFYNVRGGSVIVAPAQEKTEWGYVLSNCVIDGNAEAADGRQKLGRPWKGTPKAVWLNTLALIPISQLGWDDMGGMPTMFAEYNTLNRSGEAVDLSQRKSSYHPRGSEEGFVVTCPSSISEQEAAEYSYENVVLKSSGDWDPRLMLERLDAPGDFRLDEGVISWNAVEGAVGYIVYDGDNIIAITDSTSLKPESPLRLSLKIRAINRYGVPGKLGI